MRDKRSLMINRRTAMSGALAVPAAALASAGDPALVKADWLLPQTYDVKVTSLKKLPFNADTKRNQDAGIMPTGPIVSNEIPFILVANEARLIAAGNTRRKGLMLQNLDATDNLFYSFGPEANGSSSFLAPGQVLLLDFLCPVNSVWAFATVNLSGYYRDFTNSSSRG